MDFDQLVVPVRVHVYVDGQGFVLGPASLSRPDVGQAFPGYGDAHGFVRQLTGIAPGSHTVCAYGINVGPGFAKDVVYVTEKLADTIDLPHVFPNVGLAQMHHEVWKATIYYTETMDGCRNRATLRASRRKRSRSSLLARLPARGILMATCRSVSGSRARYTVPNVPLPASASMR